MSFKKSTAIYTLGNVFPKALSFFLLPIYTLHMSTEEFGIVNAVQAIYPVILIFFTFALDRSVFRMFFEYKSKEEKNSFFSTISVFMGGIGIFFLGLVFLFQNQIERIYSNVPFYPYFMYGIFGVYASSFTFIPKAYFHVNQKALCFVVFSIAEVIISTLFILWFVVAQKAGAVGMLKGYAYGYLFFLPVCFGISFTFLSFDIDIKKLKTSLQYCLPLTPALLSAWVLSQTDRIFIERYLSLKEVGIYSLSFRLAFIVTVLMGGLERAFGPVYFQLANSQDKENATKKLSIYCTNFIVFTIFITFSLSIVAKELVFLFFDERFSEAGVLYPLILLGLFLAHVNVPFTNAFYQKKKTLHTMLISIFMGMINLSLNFYMIPRHGMYGAAFSSITAFLVGTVLSIIFSRKHFYIPIYWNYLIRLMILSGGLMMCNSLIDFVGLKTLAIKMVLIGIIGYRLWVIHANHDFKNF